MDLKKIQPYNKSSNATNQSLTTLDVPSRTTLRPLTPYKMSSDSAQSSSANDTNRPTLLQLSRTELDEMQFGQYDNGYEAPFL
nr:unnamed protein product [Callosobruchus analis]